MTRIKLPYIQAMRDRHGTARYYFRRKGYPKATLPGLPGSTEFMAAYQAALDGKPMEIASDRTEAGTFDDLIIRWFSSARFKGYSPGTQRTYRYDAERFRKKHGKKPVVDLERRHVEKWLDDMGDRPAAANKLLTFLRVLMDYAVRQGLLKDNPLVNVTKLTSRNREGFRMWEDGHLAAFRERWPIGTRQRLALELLLSTGARRSDAVRLGPQHVREGVLTIRTLKTGEPVAPPFSADLKAAWEALPVQPLKRFVVTMAGKPFTAGGFYNWFTEASRKAGIPEGLSPHGLRKAAACHLAMQGMTVAEIAAALGWKSLALVQLYIRGVDRMRLVQSAMKRTRTPGGDA